MSRSIVIIGGGIIGTSTAYYLSRHPKFKDVSVHLIEGSSLAAGSSGKGGGFLASNWHGSTTESLGALSFRLHEELAQEHNGVDEWGYRKLVTLGIDLDPHAKRRVKKVPGANWIIDANTVSKMGDETTTAQVHPYYLTNALATNAVTSGVKVTIATVNGIDIDKETEAPSAVSAVTVDGQLIKIPATDVIFAAGPWTGRLALNLLGDKAGPAADIVPSPRSTSLIVTPPADRSITPHALFCTIVLPDGSHAQPEIYPRPDKTLYICGAGMSDRTPLPARAADVVHSDEGVERLQERLAVVVRKEWIENPEKVIKQACHRPDSNRTGAPIIGRFGKGLWVASGHQVWGILMGPGTGKVMSELLLDGVASSADISALHP